MGETASAELGELQEQVRLILDKQAIQDCVYRYARGLDRHDEEMLSSVFHEDAIDHHGEFAGMPDEFVPWALALHEADWAAHTHFLTNHRVEVDGDVAHAETYALFILKRKDGETIDLGGGRYIDRLERREGEWRIAARELVIDWSGQMSSDVYSNVATYPSGTWDRSDPSYHRPFELRLPSGVGGTMQTRPNRKVRAHG